MKIHHIAPAALAALLALAGRGAWAINGSQPPGYGVKNAAMGGASIALPLDAEAAANNPAGIAFIPRSYTLDVAIFHGESSADEFIPGNRLENRTTLAVPPAGISSPLNDRFSVGLSMAAQGVGADYRQPALPVPGAGTAQSSLKVAELIPTLAWKATPELSVGASLNLVRQQFEMSGIIVPAPVPGGLAPVPSHGTQSANGVGLRLGLLWKATPELAFGLNAKSRTRMGRLAGYADDVLAYSDGRIDVPAQYGAGVAWTPSPRATLAADWLRVDYGGLKVMQDPQGFGWTGQNVLRLGGAWSFDDSFTVRAGLSRSTTQIPTSRIAQNVLVPSLFDRSFTGGLTWRTSERSEFSLALEIDPRRTQVGTEASAGVTLSAKAYFLMLGYQARFD